MKELQEMLETLPADLNARYETTWDQINSQAPKDRDLAQRAIAWVVHAKEPLHPMVLGRALAVNLSGGHVCYHKDAVYTAAVIVSVCGGFLTIDEDGEVVRPARKHLLV